MMRCGGDTGGDAVCCGGDAVHCGGDAVRDREGHRTGCPFSIVLMD